MTISGEYRKPSAFERRSASAGETAGAVKPDRSSINRSANAYKPGDPPRPRVTPIAAAVAASLCAGPALVRAQEPPADTVLQEIVVTASRRNENLQDVPINISAVSGSTIDDLRLDTLAGLTRLVPGVALIDQGAWNDNRLIMRGLSADSITNSQGPADGGTVATYLNETPLYVSFKLLDIDRVEVLIGPQGTLYGAGTLAGAVRYIPKRPDLFKFDGAARGRTYSVAHGDDPGFEGDGVLNVPLIEGTLALRAVAGYYHDPGFVDSPLLVRDPGVSNPEPDLNNPDAVAANLRRVKDSDNERTFASRLSLLYQPFEKLDALLTYAHQNSNVGGRRISPAPLLGLGPYDNGTRVPEPAHSHTDLVSLELTADLGFAELVSSSSYARRDRDYTRDQTDLLLSFEYGYENFPSFVALARADLPFRQSVEELRLVSRGNGPFKWIVGGFYNHNTDGTIYQEHTPGYPQFAGIDRPDELEYFSETRRKQTESAVFGELGYQFTDAWQVTVGGRHFRYKQEQSSRVAFPLLSGDPVGIDTNFLTISQDQSGSLFKINTSYKFTPDLMLYATVSEGYRLGGINDVPPCVLPLDPNVPQACALPDEQAFKPDRTRNHELGVRSTWLDKRLTIDGAVYYVKWKDVQVGAVTVYGQEQITVNGATAVSKGVELNVDAVLPQGLTVMGSYAYTNARLTQDVPGLVIDHFGKHEAFDGDRLPGSPQHTASLVLQYNRPLAGGYLLRADYGATYTGDVFTKAGLRGNGEKLGGYTLHQASIGLGRNNWLATLYGENLFDKYAYTGTTLDTSELGTVNGFTLRRYNHWLIRPRQVGLELSVKF